MKTKTLVLLLTLLVVCNGLWTGPALAQDGPLSTSVDVYIGPVRFSNEPVVNEPVTVSATVNTTGPAVVDVSFEWGDESPLNDGLPTNSQTQVRFTEQGPGSRTASMRFTPAMTRAGPQEIRIEATVRSSQDTNLTNNTVLVKTVVRIPKLNLTFEEPHNRNVTPQGEAIIRYFVRNDGNVPDNATPLVDVWRDSPWTVEAWSLPVVEPGKSVTGILIVRPNATATNLTNLSLNLTARSGISSAGDQRLQAPIMNVNESMYQRKPKIAFDPLPVNVQVFPAEERALLFTVRNTGDIDHVVRVRPGIDFAPVGWNASMRLPPTWPANLSAPVDFNSSFPVPLRPNESAVLQVNLTRAQSTPNATALLRLTANTTNGDRINTLVGGGYRAEASAILSDAGPDLTPNLTASVGTLYQGDAPSFRIEIRNVGRGNASNSSIHLELRDNLRAVEETDIRIPPIGPGNSTNVTWTPSTTGLRGAYVLLGRIDVNASQQDRNVLNNTLRVDLHVRAPELNVRAPEAVRIVPGGRLTLASSAGGLSVENMGDRDEVVVARLESGHSWLQGEWRVNVPPGTRQPLPLQLDVPLLPGAQSIAATFSAQVEARPRFSASVPLVFEVDDVEAPRVTLVSPTADGVVGKETRLAVRATDASGIRRAEVILQSPGGERTALPLQRDTAEPDVYFTRHTPGLLGVYTLEFRIEDASLGARPATLGNVTWTVRAPDYAGMKAVNFGEGAHVGAQPLKLAEVKPGTTRSVLVDVGAGYVSLGSPYEIVLPPVEGRRVVAVRATSNDGTLWEGRWNVTIDLTPPSVQEPVSRNAGAGKVELEVKAAGAKEVVARFETQGGSPVEVNLAGRGGGVFGATVTAPASWDNVVFIAKDEAGNEGSASVAAPDNDTPGVGAALLALAALGAALVLGRRRA